MHGDVHQTSDVANAVTCAQTRPGMVRVEVRNASPVTGRGGLASVAKAERVHRKNSSPVNVLLKYYRRATVGTPFAQHQCTWNPSICHPDRSGGLPPRSGGIHAERLDFPRPIEKQP